MSYVKQTGTGTAAPNGDTIFASPTVSGPNPAAIVWPKPPGGPPGFWISLSTTTACASPVRINPQPGQSVNMVSGTGWPGGDPFLQRQNEGSGAFSTRNPLHMVAGANDYRSVDIPFPAINLEDEEYAGDAWLGLFKSFDGGQTWQSTLLPGFPQDHSPEGDAFRSGWGGDVFGAAADPVVRAGVAGLFYFAGIAFDRPTPPDPNPTAGALFVARLMDLNNKENGDATQSLDPIRLIGVSKVESTTPTAFLDKPSMAVDVPRGDLPACSFTVPQSPPAGNVNQTVPAGRVYVAYSAFSGSGNTTQATVFLRTSSDCGQSWGPALPLSTAAQRVSQGTAVAIDPVAGNVFVAWRQFAVGVPGPGYQPNAINVVKVTGGGTVAGPVFAVQSLDSYTSPVTESFFDQATTAGTFRTNAYPSMAIDGTGRVYVTWSQRISPLGDARIMLSSFDGTSWSAPSRVDDSPVVDDTGHAFSRGHQFMPQATFNGGRLTIVYYDLRLDHTLGLFDAVTGFPKPDTQGRFELETRSPCTPTPTTTAPCAGEAQLASPNGAPVFTPFISDTAFTAGGLIYPELTLRRHTLDVRLAQAGPGAAPVFTTQRLSNFKFGTRGDEVVNIGSLQQLQVNPPNLPMFQQGEVPFFADYIDILGVPFVQSSPGGPWSFNSAPTKAGTQFAIWTSNQDVVPPYDASTGTVDWSQYTPPFSAANNGTSVYDGSVVPPCQAPFSGSRNQNIYGALITQDFLFSSPQNSKPLATNIQRAFVVVAQNMSNFDRTFRVVIENQPAGGWASFRAGTNQPLAPPSPLATTLDLAVAAHSSASRSVFATSSSATANIMVSIAETSSIGGPLVVNGLTGFVVLNGDATAPGLVPPDGGSGDPGSVEVYTPNVTNPNVTNPNVTNPNVTNPNVTNPNVTNPNVTNPNVTNPNVTNADIANLNLGNPNVTNPNVTNPNVTNPNVTNVDPTNPNVTNQSVSDTVYQVSDGGNTSGSYRIALVGTVPSNVTTQLIITKTYKTPAVLDCQLFEQDHELLLANIVNPVFLPPNANLSDPSIFDAGIGNPTVALKPGESATVVLRAFSNDPLPGGLTQVSPVVVPQAANTNDPTNTPTAVGPGGTTITGALQILTSSLPDAVIGQSYSASLAAIGGTPNPNPANPPYAWDSSGGPPPAGISLLGTGQVTGLPTGPTGTSVFTVHVFDSGAPTATTSRDLNIRVFAPLQITTASPLPAATVGSAYATSVVATGGLAPFTFSVIGGALPSGLTLSAGGAVTGAPTAAGTSNFTVQAKDSANPPQLTSRAYTLVVDPGLNVSFSIQPPPTAIGNQSFDLQVHVQDATASPIPGAHVALSFGNTACVGVEVGGSMSGLTDPAGNAAFNLSLSNGGYGWTFVAAVAGAPSATSSAFDVEGFCGTGPANFGRSQPVVVKLADGRVLVAGGASVDNVALSSAEIYDPSTGNFTPTSNTMEVGRQDAQGVLLADGRVLIAGGTNGDEQASADIFDPGTGLFSPTANLMSIQRRRFQLTRLNDGRVIATGGSNSGFAAIGTGDLFDPASGLFTPLPNTMLAPRRLHTATLLSNGNVLLAGGVDASGNNVSFLEEFVPLGGSFVFTGGTMAQPRNSHTANRLASGNVLIAGGNAPSVGTAATTAAEVVTVSGSSAATGSLNAPRMSAQAAPLPDGRILVAGGSINAVDLATAEVYTPTDATTGTFSFTGNLASPRSLGSAVTLNDGRVLVVGSAAHDNTAELFYPRRQVAAIFSEFPIPTPAADAVSIATGPDGALWFTEQLGSQIGRVTPAGVITEYPLPSSGSHQPYGIAAGPDGALWFTEANDDRIGRITTSGGITEFATPTSGGFPSAIVAGPDGALWFTELAGNKIGRITADAVPTITEYAVPTDSSNPHGIAVGPDGALWFTEYGGNKIGRITTGGVITEYAVPTDSSQPYGIAAGPDGALWFTEYSGNKIGRITTTGAVTEYPVPTTYNSQPSGIAAGSDGALWFSESNDFPNKIGRVTTSGAFTEFPTPTIASFPDPIAAGPDGAVWFVENGSNKIGRLNLTSGAAPVFGLLSISNVQLNGGGSVLVLPGGGSFTLDHDYFISNDAVYCPTCILQIEVGPANALYQSCTYDGVPLYPGVSAHGSAVLTVPSTPGTYYIGFDVAATYFCHQFSNWASGPPGPNRYLGVVIVP